MSIDWTTVIFEMVNFVLLVGIMIRFVFRPVARILDERREAMHARAVETQEREAAAAAERARFEAELARIDEVAEDRVGEALGEAREQAEAIVREARELARDRLDDAEAALGEAKRRTLERFRDEVFRVASDAARRLVGELGGPELVVAYARRAAHALEDSMGGAVRGPVQVWHSPDADPDLLAAVLREKLGPEVQLVLAADPELIGGLRLLAEGREVEASAGASLEGWYGELAREGG